MSAEIRCFALFMAASWWCIGPVAAQDRREARPEARQQLQGVHVGTFAAEVATKFTTNDGLPSNDVLSLALTSDGIVYAGTAQGLARFQDGKWERVGDYNGAVKLLAPDGKNVIALAEGALFRVGTGLLEQVVELPTRARDAKTLYSLQAGKPLLLATSNGLFATGDIGQLLPVAGLSGMEVDVRAAAVAKDGRRAVAGRHGLFVDTGEGWSPVYPTDGKQSWAPRDVRGVAFDSQDQLWVASPQGVAVQTDSGWRLWTGYDGLPFDDFTTVTPGEEGIVWFGTTKGALRFDGETWEYRQAPRWLPDHLVRQIVVDDKGNTWFATPQGVGRIERKPMTLADKAAFYESEIDKYHRRTPYGYVLGVRLNNPNDKSEWTQHDSDNDGLWTAMYGAGECFAYAATKDPLAKKRAKDAFEALRFLSEVTQGGSHPAPHGFPARTILPTSGPNPNENPGYTVEGDRQRQERDPQWKIISPRWPTSADGKWYWKTDTSSDELDGHYFAYAVYYDLVAETEEEKQRVRDVVVGITDHLLEHDYALIDHDGKKTRWARFSPADLNSGEMISQRPLNTLSILSYLKVAEHMTGDRKYTDAYNSLLNDHGYKASILISKTQSGPGTGNQSDDEMAFMCYYTALSYEDDPELRQLYLSSFADYWRNEQPELNPLFNFIFAAKFDGSGRFRRGASQETITESIDTLKRYPIDRVRWGFDNTHRTDIVRTGAFGRNERGHRRNGFVIPIDERSVEHWNHDPWTLREGGDGRTLADGASFLLPYYMGRYHGFIIED
ncbi:MAG: hypothetical protein KF861_03170 [Planctomycetaceae bacterium]|nr:hypothetical protein [Planctomycetaceae bacterium]